MWTLALMGTSPTATGKRLKALHVALDVSQADVCRAIKVSENRYSQYVNGRRGLPTDIALRLKTQYGVTTDYLFAGDVSTLPQHLHRALARVAAA